jgi:hypothetical protein
VSGHGSPLKARRRADVLYAAAVIACLVALAWVVVTMQQLGHDLRTANSARDALAQQVQSLGGKPVSGPPGSRGAQGESVVGPPGEKGDPGPSGPTGPVGPTGKAGAKGTDGAGEVGPTGEPGTDGQAGTDGQTVTGPAGPQGDPGPAGPAGQPGADGKDGTDGTDGRDGTDGQTCPDGYTLQPPADDPDALVCRRTPADTPSSAASQGTLGLGALTTYAAYKKKIGVRNA